MEAPDLGQGKNLGEVCVCVYKGVCLGEGYVCVSMCMRACVWWAGSGMALCVCVCV